MKEYADRVEHILREKEDLRKLQNQIAEEEYGLVKDLATRAPEMLSINWTRLCRATGVTPMRYRG